MQYGVRIVIASLSAMMLGACSASSFGDLAVLPQAAPAAMLEAAPQGEVQTETAALAAAGPSARAVRQAELAYATPDTVEEIAGRAAIDLLIARHAAKHKIPASLVHHVVNRESTYRPHARNGIYYGLMQINPATARTMGYRGAPEGLLDADTNLTYGVKYLAGAYLVARGDAALADRLYRSGYYYRAKSMGLLEETGLKP